MSSEPALVPAARRICDEGTARGIHVRLLGGIAIWLRASDSSRGLLGREYGDIDLIASRKQSKPLRELLEELGYLPDKMFNATHGASRLYYSAADGAYHLDVFLHKFVMSHELELHHRLELEPTVLSAADLLLTKLQIAELNRKDAADTAMLLLDHQPGEGDGPGVLNVAYVAELCARNWGLYTTVTDNLASTRSLLDEIVPDPERRQLIAGRIDSLLSDLEAAPKSGSWKRRSKIGRRMRWYETPDEAERAPGT
jgi:hypothetical protein